MQIIKINFAVITKLSEIKKTPFIYIILEQQTQYLATEKHQFAMS